jgi:D-glycero-alpha-D-manno-heptose-7-phosphate kinase
MSFFGGGTDIPEFFYEHGGSVISSTFNKYCYVHVRHLPRFFDYSSQVVYSRIERVKSVNEIEHPAVRECMKFLDMRELIVSYDADLPARTGLGTSSSFVVGMLNAFYALKGKYAGKTKLADEAIHVERDLCNEAGGWQDQIAASFGGFNRIDFTREGYEVSPVIISPERKHELNDNLLLFFSGFSRLSSEIQNDTKKNIHDKTRQLLEMKSLVDDAERILTDKRADINDFGRLLNETWKLKRQTGSKISTSDIDSLYERAMKAGALGGKLLGAGGGGFLLFYVPRENQKVLIESLRELLLVPFEFENNGTDIIYYDPENYSLEE